MRMHVVVVLCVMGHWGVRHLDAGPATQYGLFNTGVDDQQVVLGDDDVDPHYELVEPSLVEGDAIVATSAGGFPIGPWLADGERSAWITPAPDTNGPGDVDGAPSYYYETTFDLTGVQDIDDLVIQGRWATDNGGLDILLNDEPLNYQSAGFASYSAFTLETEFVEGLNTLAFVVNNGANEENPSGPTGLRVQFDGNGNASTRHPDAIPGLYATGVDENGDALFGSVLVDPHYTIVSDAFDEEQDAVTVPNDGFPIPPWIGNSERSRWISPSEFEDDDASGEPGNYLYETTFDLTGRDPDNLAISGWWAVDDGGASILLNDVPVPVVASRGFSTDGNDPRVWFGINAASVAEAGADLTDGLNTLAFEVVNAGETFNPTGLRVDGLVSRAAPVDSIAIPGLFNTGVDDDGLPLEDDESDPHYELVSAPDDAADPAIASATPPGAWADNTATSRWIAPSNDSEGNGPVGDYEFELEFDMTDLDVNNATILGRWGADNNGGDILLNGNPTDNAQDGGFAGLSDFEISSEMGHTFLPGKNTLTFLVANVGDADNPVGLRVEGLMGYVGGSLVGDYNRNGVLDADDLDLQAVAISSGENPVEFDLNGDGVVDYNGDRVKWVEELKRTYIGDADLNGVFDDQDFVTVFVAGKYLTGESAGWEDGDWNGDLRFDEQDLVVAFVAGGYLQPPREAVAAVPEPSCVGLMGIGVLGLLTRRRHGLRQ